MSSEQKLNRKHGYIDTWILSKLHKKMDNIFLKKLQKIIMKPLNKNKIYA